MRGHLQEVVNAVAEIGPLQGENKMDLTDEARRSYLKDEYLFLQAQYEDFDRRSLTIKGWFSGGAVAAFALTFNTPSPYTYFVPLSVLSIACVFWYLETYWKLFQYGLSDRIRVIEAYFRNDQDILVKSPDPFQIYNWWFRSYSRDEPIYDYERKGPNKRPRPRHQRFWQIAFQRFVCLPYVVFAVLSASVLVSLAFTDLKRSF